MALVVWFTVGLALWHFTVFLPDRFWAGIVGALLGAVVGAMISGGIAQIASGRTIGDTDIGTALVAIPGTVVGLAVIGTEALATMGTQGVIGDLSFVTAGSLFAIFATLLRLWRIEPMRARPVPFCRQSLRPEPETSPRRFVLTVPCRWFIMYALTASQMSGLLSGAPKTRSSRSSWPTVSFFRFLTSTVAIGLTSSPS